MDNRGKIWSADDDKTLMEWPQLPNAHFSESLGRSENAIKMRRSHLAAKMHLSDPSTSLEEYVGLMWGDLEHATQLLQEWSDKRATFKTFLDSNRKRKLGQPLPVPPETADARRSRFFKEESKPPPQDAPNYWHDNTPEQSISAICQSIREESGNIASVFNDPQYLPILIQHYPGFEAYARIVQARQ